MRYKLAYVVFSAAVLCLLMATCIASAAQIEVLRPGKLSISRKIKKVFINPAMINSKNDSFNLKSQVIATLQRRLNKLGRFQVFVGPPTGFDPNRETVAVIQGDVISGGEVDQGQLTEKAECKSGLAGIVGAVTAAETSAQGITFSRRRMACKLPNLQSQIAEKGISVGLSLMGVQDNPRIDEVIRVYKYKNYSIFAQVNLSFTQIGVERETLAIRADAASFSRHIISPQSFRNVRESGDNSGIIWLWFRVTPIAPVMQKHIGVVSATNPGSYRARWYDFLAPDPTSIPARERKQIAAQLVEKTLTEFIRTISPYKTVIEADIAGGGNAAAIRKLENGRFLDVQKMLKSASEPDDLYNLGFAFEAGATTIEDYEDALRYYSQALDKAPGTKLYALGVGRMEFQLRIHRKLKAQTGN